jgi:hypothetical protein
VPQQLARLLAAQLALDLAGVLLGHRRGPFRREPGVHHHPAEVAVGMQQRLPAQPVQQHVAVVGEQHALEIGIDLALLRLAPLRDRQQRQVVVAEHHHRLRPQRMHQPQRLQRLAAAVHQVAAEPEAVACRIEPDPVEQALGGAVAALQVSDRPDGHAWL